VTPAKTERVAYHLRNRFGIESEDILALALEALEVYPVAPERKLWHRVRARQVVAALRLHHLVERSTQREA